MNNPCRDKPCYTLMFFFVRCCIYCKDRYAKTVPVILGISLSFNKGDQSWVACHIVWAYLLLITSFTASFDISAKRERFHSSNMLRHESRDIERLHFIHLLRSPSLNSSGFLFRYPFRNTKKDWWFGIWNMVFFYHILGILIPTD